MKSKYGARFEPATLKIVSLPFNWLSYFESYQILYKLEFSIKLHFHCLFQKEVRHIMEDRCKSLLSVIETHVSLNIIRIID